MRKDISHQIPNIVLKKEEEVRLSEYKINPLILNRWSPRAMSWAEELSNEELMSLFEAAKWAPSSANAQPWRFIYAKRNTVGAEDWNRLFNLLADFNKSWAKNAAVLVVVVSKKEFEYNGKVIPSVTHQFDTGAAWENLSLEASSIEASSIGLAAYAMAGFDYEKARKDLDIPDGYDVMAMIAIGKRDPKGNFPLSLQERKIPSDRKPLEEIVMEGLFKQERN
jgi:nitroreductase